ncbi:MAG TPA: hypothetical protein VIS75_02940, partial [Chitinophagaceae bacterium]
KNRYAIATKYAEKVIDLFVKDSLITTEYHRLNGGKWNHMMSQTHMGYTYWQQPPKQKMPDVNYTPIDSNWQKFVDHDSVGNGLDYLESAVIKGKPIPHWHGKYYSVQANHFTRSINSDNINWKIIPGIGRDGHGVTTFPVTAEQEGLNSVSPRLEYEVFLYHTDTGQIKLNAYFSPTLNFHGTEKGLQYAISIDDEAPQIISINSEDKNSISGIWNKWVAENIIIKTSTHKINEAGKHVVKYWMVNPGVVLQKLVLDFGGVVPSYLGPPETRTIK